MVHSMLMTCPNAGLRRGCGLCPNCRSIRLDGAGDLAAAVLDDKLSGLGMMRRAMPEARKLIMKGCDLCPHSEDVWLEAARLQTPEHAKALLARGVSYNQTSVKLWIQVGTALTPSPQACPWQLAPALYTL